MPIDRRAGIRKLLIASVGVASISYVGCDAAGPTGNLMAPLPCDAGGFCRDAQDAGSDVQDAGNDATDTDATSTQDAGDANG